MELTRVLIAVKTYPTISAKYDELVCTAGFREDGTWIRIYPVSYRKKAYNEQYKSMTGSNWTWLKTIVGHIDTDSNWEERRKIALGKIYYNLTELIAEAKDSSLITSLAVFKPAQILDLKIEPSEREWDKEKLASLQQLNIFEKAGEHRFEVVKKLPYKFSYVFMDNQGEKSQLMIEIGKLASYTGTALQRMKAMRTRPLRMSGKNTWTTLQKLRICTFF